MFYFKELLVFLSLFVISRCQQEAARGVQLRLTEKGMFYAVDVGIKIMKEDIKGKAINEKGKSGNFQYDIQNLRITKADFANYELTPVVGTGMRGQISGISINAAGKLWFKYKKSWFPTISKTVGINIKTENIHVDMTIKVGSDLSGHPTIGVESCKAGVSKIDLHFSGGMSWLFNLFSGLIEDKLKDSFGKLLCNMAIQEINTKAKSELATFPVVKKIDHYAEIDYRLTHAPKFTTDYMDAYLKGEFKSSKNPVESELKMPAFTSSSDHSKMLYFWVTDYTLNTAGNVYHKSGMLSYTVKAWDTKVPSTLKDMLNSGKFGLLFPKLESMYPNRPMSVEIDSYKAPKVMMAPNKLTLNLYANTVFRVQDKDNKIQEAFTINFDIKAEASIQVLNDNITGHISDFEYDATVVKSEVGKNIISLDSTFVKLILERTVISKANPFLKKGFPLPKVDEVTLENFDIKIEQSVICIGSDIRYKNDKKK